MLNPFAAMSKESEAKAQQMVDQMAVVFEAEFKAKRGNKLTEGFNYTTGEIWGGEEALTIGLIDEIGTIETVISREWKLPTHDFGPTNQAKGFLSAFWLGNSRTNFVCLRYKRALKMQPFDGAQSRKFLHSDFSE